MQSTGFDTLTFSTIVYYDGATILKPYYSSSQVFEDFLATVIMKGIPQAVSSPLYNTGAYLRLLNGRQNSFFADRTFSLDYIQGPPLDSILEADVGRRWDRASGATITYDSARQFVHLNAKLGVEQLAGLEYVEAARSVLLNSAPFIDGMTSTVIFKLGEALWVTMPVISDAEEDGTTPFNLVDFDYSTDYEETQLPPANEFFKIDMSAGYILSKTFTQDHEGSHSLNVTIADDFGSQVWFEVSFKVLGV